MSCADQSYIFKDEPTSAQGWKTEAGNVTKRGISMDDIRRFLEDHEDAQSINASDLSLSNLFTIAQDLGVNLYPYNFLEPHNMVEFLGADFINNTAPSISLNGDASITIPRSWNNGTGYIVSENGQDIRVAFFKPVWTIPNGYNCIAWKNGICNSKYGNNYLNRIMGISMWTEDGRMLTQVTVLPEYSDYTSNDVFGQYGPQLYGGAPTYPTGGWAKSGNNLIVHTREIWSWQGGVFYFPICNDDNDVSFNGSGCSSTISNYFSNVNNTGYWCNVDCATDASRTPYGTWQFRMQEVDINGNNILSTQTPFLYDLYDIGSGGSYIYQDPGVTVNDPDEGDISSRTRTMVYFYDTHNIIGEGSSYSFPIHLHGWYIDGNVIYASSTSDYTHFQNRSININYNQAYWTSVWEFYYQRDADSQIQWIDGTIPGRYLFEYTVYDQCEEEATIEREVIVPLS